MWPMPWLTWADESVGVRPRPRTDAPVVTHIVTSPLPGQGRDYDHPRFELAPDQSFAVTRNPMALRDRQS
jgi:hypothetical protein